MYYVAMATLGDIVRKHREARGWKTRQLGKMVGTSGSTISQIENGNIKKPDPHIISELADVFEIDERILLRAMGYLRHTSDAVGEAAIQTIPLDDDWAATLRRYGSREAAMRHIARIIEEAGQSD